MSPRSSSACTLGLLVLCTLLQAQNPASAAASDPAGREFAEFQEKYLAPEPAGLSREASLRRIDRMLQDNYAAGLVLIGKYPADPRRWNIVLLLRRTGPTFIKEVKPEVDTLPPREAARAVVADEAAKAAWSARIDALCQALATAPDATTAQREQLAWMKLMEDLFARGKAGGRFDAEDARARFLVHLRQFDVPESTLVSRADRYVASVEYFAPGGARAEWAALQNAAPGEALRRHAGEKMRFIDMQHGALDFSFTAVDGRPVDLKALRGKVVLVDFWATWCGPCKAELPNVIANHQKYHDRGFEVIGIALENAHLTPDDPPEQRQAKLAQAKQVLTDFTAAHDMPWPQYFDGKYWRTSLAANFSITSIPAMFLLDQEGRIVTKDARGPKLEAEIKRLLKL